MKVFKMILVLAVVFTAALSVEAQKKGEKTVVFNADLHCGSCKSKVEKNIPYEKGVKDLKVDMKAKTVTITFREDKNTVEQLRKAIEKLHIEVTGCNGSSCASINSCDSSCCQGKKKECCQGEKKGCCQKEKK